MITPTLKQLTGVLHGLAPGQLGVLFRSVLQLNAKDELTVGRDIQTSAYLYEWLLHLGIVTDAQAGEIVQRVRRFGVLASAALTIVTIADGRYVTWTSLAGWFDVQECQEVAELPVPAVTLISCHLRALFDIKQTWLKKRCEEGHGSEHCAGGTDRGHGDQPGRASAPVAHE